MKIILSKDVPKLGKRYDVKSVSDGHALNLLIPRGLAILATPEALKNLETQKARLEGERKVQEELLLKNIKELEGVTLNITGKANDKGHLFAGLHREEIASELNKQTKLVLDPSFIQVDHPIKEIGTHSIVVKTAGKSVSFKLIIKKA